MRALVVCSANRCRSPLAAALLRARLGRWGSAVEVGDAGFRAAGLPVTDEVIAVASRRGLDLSEHRSRTVAPAAVRAADLVLTMEAAHVRDVVALAPEAWPRTYTLKELVRRGTVAGPRDAGETLAAWLTRVQGDRTPRDLLGGSGDDDVADPTGGPLAEHEDTARELEGLVDALAMLAWPPATHDRD